MTDQPGDFARDDEPEDECPTCGHDTLCFVETYGGSRYPSDGGNPEPPECESYCMCQKGRGEEGCKCDYEY